MAKWGWGESIERRGEGARIKALQMDLKAEHRVTWRARWHRKGEVLGYDARTLKTELTGT